MRTAGFFAILGMFLCCNGNSTTGPSPTTAVQQQPATTTTSVEPIPTLVSHAATSRIQNSIYVEVSWKFTVDSPFYCRYVVVRIRWYDSDGFEVSNDKWFGPVDAGISEFTSIKYIRRSTWDRVVRRSVRMEAWSR